jgi:hypothetical protein
LNGRQVIREASWIRLSWRELSFSCLSGLQILENRMAFPFPDQPMRSVLSEERATVQYWLKLTSASRALKHVGATSTLHAGTYGIVSGY